MFDIRLFRKEYKMFCALLPLTSLGITEDKKSKALSIIGLDNPLIFDLLIHHDPDILNAFHVSLFALQLKSFPVELASFLSRVDFKDRGFKSRLFKELRYSPRKSVDSNIISAKELDAWWKLESKYDDGGEPIIE